MSKKHIYFLVFCMVSMGFLVLIPSASAKVGTIITTEPEGAPDNFFKQGDYIYYQTAMPIAYAGVQIKITITDELGTQVHTNFEYLDSNAEYKSWNPSLGQSSDFYYITGSEAVGPNWNISVFDAGTLELLNWHIFEVYIPSVWTSTIRFFEDSGYSRPTTKFPVDSRVYYSVKVEDEYNAPLKWTYVDIFVEHNSQKYNIDDILLDDEGYADDYFDIDWYWFSTSDQIGEYTMEVQEPLGTPLANTKNFSVYDPIYTATIKTFTGGYTTSASIFPADAQVYWKTHIQDQHGRNLTGKSVYLQIEHEGSFWRFWADTTDGHGNASDNFWLWSSPWDEDEQIGLYTIRISDGQYNDPFLGSADFEVIGLKLSPDKDKYSQGEEITITITSSKYQSNIDVTIYDDKWSKIASWEDQSMGNRIWTVAYTFADSLPDGQYYIRVNESETDRALGSLELSVKKYTLQIWTDAEAYLPEETITVFYTVTSNKDGRGVSGTLIEWKLRYYDTEELAWKTIKSDNPFSTSASGTFSVNIPETASILHTPVFLHIWANDTNNHWYYWPETINLGKIDADVNVQSNEYLAGDFVVVSIQGTIENGWPDYPLREGNVALNVSLNGVEIATYTASGLKLDMEGVLSYIFQLHESAELGDYIVTVNVSKKNDWDITSDMFEVVEKRQMWVSLMFDGSPIEDPDYFTGETVTVTYTVFRGEDIIETVNCEYEVYDSSGDIYFEVGTTSAGEFTFDIPDNYEGRLRVRLTITDSEGNKISKIGNIDVYRAVLLLKPSTNYYSPGTTVKIAHSLVGNEIENAQYYYEIEANGYLIIRESLPSSSGEFQFTVPTENAPNYYHITGYITDSKGAIISKSEIEVYRQKSYMLTFTLDKNTYRPGEEATLHYKIISLDGSEIPKEYALSYGFYGGEPRSIQTSGSEGDLKVKVPDDASDGEGYFFMYSSDLSSSSAQQEADIRTSPNPLAETVGDIPIFSYILLILVIVALLIGIAAWKHGKTALEESKMPPWKKERPLPEPEQYKGEGEEGLPPSEDESLPPPEEEVPPPSGDMGSSETSTPPQEPKDTNPPLV